MSRSVLWLPLSVIVGTVALFLLPIVRLNVLVVQMGLTALTVLMAVDAIVALARALSPTRSNVWIPRTDSERRDVTWTALGIEVSISAGAIALLAATRGWWGPALGLTPPLWLFALLALRAAGLATLVTIGGLRRPFALLLALFDFTFVLPIVSLFDGSLQTVVVASTAITGLFVLLAMWMPVAPIPATQEPHTRWPWGNWLSSISGELRRPLIVVFGGLAALVPLSAALTLQSLMVTPFWIVGFTLAASKTRLAPMSVRVARAVLLASAAFAVIYLGGPWFYTVLFPAELGDGAAMRVLAWGALFVVPALVREDPERNTSQLRKGLAAAVEIALLVALGLLHGLDGLVLGIAVAMIARSAITSVARPGRESLLSQ
jgi:uncharacterized membrane protein YagU involved in acid resistance